MANYIDRINAGLNVVLRRQSGAPLDVSEVFLNLADFEAYVLQNSAYNNAAYSEEENAFLNQINPYSYAGQVVGVVENGAAKAYIINKVGALETNEDIKSRYSAVGTEVSVDSKTLVNVGGVLMLANIPEERTKVLQPALQLDGTLTWTEISETTVEGLSALISALTTRVDGIDNRVKAVEEAYIKAVEYNSNNGTFSFTKQDGTKFEVDLAIEKVVTNFVYNEEEKALVLTLADGTTQTVAMSAFIDVYSGIDGATVKVEVSESNAISAEVKDGTIGANKLAETVNADIAKGVDAQTRVAAVEPKVETLESKVATLEGAGHVTAAEVGAMADATTIVYDSGKLKVGTITGSQVSGAVASAQSAAEASKVTSALNFGDKSYDGSSVQTITAEDLGAATPDDIHSVVIKGAGVEAANNNNANAELDIIAGSDNVTIAAEEGKISISVVKPVFEDTNRAIKVNDSELLGAANKSALEFADSDTIGLDVSTGKVVASVKESSINADKLAENAVTEAKISNAAVTTNKIAANAVVTTHIANGAVTDAKLDTVNAMKLFLNSGDKLVFDCGTASEV